MTIDLGKIKLNWQSTYSSTQTYVRDDLVFYNYSAWICKVTSVTNIAPDLASPGNQYWDIFAQGGTGLHGTGVPALSVGFVGSTYVNDIDGSLYWKTLSGWYPHA